MADKANIRAIDLVQDFKNALSVFGEEVRMAVSTANADMQRMVNRLRGEYATHWKQEHRKWTRKLAEAKTDLYRVQLQMQNTRERPIEQMRAVERAERHVKEAEWKLERIKHWLRELERAAMQCRGQLQPLDQTVEIDLPRAAAQMDQMLSHLEAYINLHAPTSQKAEASAVPAEARPGDGSDSAKRSDVPPAVDASAETGGAQLDFVLSAAYRDRVRIPANLDLQAITWSLSEDDQQQVAALDLPIDPPFPDDRVIIAKAALTCSSLIMHRTTDAPPDDSGWLILPGDHAGSPPEPEECVALRFRNLMTAAATLEPLAILPRGTLVRLKGSRMVELIDPEGRSKWQHRNEPERSDH